MSEDEAELLRQFHLGDLDPDNCAHLDFAHPGLAAMTEKLQYLRCKELDEPEDKVSDYIYFL